VTAIGVGDVRAAPLDASTPARRSTRR
jgi:hypothetical protein